MQLANPCNAVLCDGGSARRAELIVGCHCDCGTSKQRHVSNVSRHLDKGTVLQTKPHLFFSLISLDLTLFSPCCDVSIAKAAGRLSSFSDSLVSLLFFFGCFFKAAAATCSHFHLSRQLTSFTSSFTSSINLLSGRLGGLLPGDLAVLLPICSPSLLFMVKLSRWSLSGFSPLNIIQALILCCIYP